MFRQVRVWVGVVALLVVALTSYGCNAADALMPETAIPSFAESGQCGGWSCSSGVCGYDPGSDPRGACCLYPAGQGEAPEPKPTCDIGICDQMPDLCDPADPGPNWCSETGHSTPGHPWCDPTCLPPGTFCNTPIIP